MEWEHTSTLLKTIFSYHVKTSHWKQKLDMKQNGGWGIKYDSAKFNMLTQSPTHLQLYLGTSASATHLHPANNYTEWAMHFPGLTNKLAAPVNETHAMVWSSFLSGLCNCCECIYWVSLTRLPKVVKEKEVCIYWWCSSICYRSRITDSWYKSCTTVFA